MAMVALEEVGRAAVTMAVARSAAVVAAVKASRARVVRNLCSPYRSRTADSRRLLHHHHTAHQTRAGATRFRAPGGRTCRRTTWVAAQAVLAAAVLEKEKAMVAAASVMGFRAAALAAAVATATARLTMLEKGSGAKMEEPLAVQAALTEVVLSAVNELDAKAVALRAAMATELASRAMKGRGSARVAWREVLRPEVMWAV